MQAMNLLLASLSTADAAAIRPNLKPVQFEHQRVLYEAGDPVRQVYFPTTAIVSLVVGLSTGETVEAAMVGRDGAVGAAAALDGNISVNRAVVQIAGDGLVCEADVLKGAALQSHTLLSTLLRHEQMVLVQAQQSAACMATHDVEARLCRWLLRARDLTGGDTLPFTQEFLAEMLGVRRTSVSSVAHTLQRAGMIKYARGKIQIVDADAVSEGACECYATVKSQYEALLGPGRK
jgi:CRP-like cAMP-binding protein